ncbi:MAG TPA: tellurite resistance TerB C-terminal domain-containing protein [Prolixibacteraceae bacterium]|nr:tellurite resistance TerB C-terminal domain-containing protein [Prolixibacteraceae bacterium]
MAKNNNSLHPILILLGFVALIITKLVEFITENIIPILTILGLGFGVFLVFYIFKQRINLKEKRQPNKKSTKQSNVSLSSTTALMTSENPKNNNYLDQTIIDVNAESFDLSIDKERIESKSQLEVPIWSHSYVYSYDAIRYASNQQKKFYFLLRDNLLKGKLIDIQGNTNYAFILYFDLLNEYENHKNIKLIEEQFNLIGQICPKTKSYTLLILIDELKKRSDSYSIEKLKELENPLYRFENGYTDYNPYQYKLGSLFEDKLKLDKREVELLNKIWHSSNVFLSIDNCLFEVIRQYCIVLKELERNWNTKGISNNITDLIKNELMRKQDYFDSFESDVYLSIFKKVENIVRGVYGHNRKITEDVLLKYSTRVQSKFEKYLGEEVDEILVKCKCNILWPDKSTQIELNAQNINRWKIEFNELKDTFQKNGKKKFIDGIINLEETNQKNPNIENIFFEASKFIATHDKEHSLKYYVKYIYYDLKSKKIDNQQLTTTIQKSLFATNEQLLDFHSIIEKLIQSSNIEEALIEIPNIYIPKRKKIILDKIQIKEVEKKHTNTVELLNEILVNESVELKVNPINNKNTDEELEVSFGIKTKNNLFFKSEIDLNKVQEQLVQKIATNSFMIHQNEVAEFALDNGLFKNQLIDSINEICAEFLEGGALIEEEEDNYIIDESYYLEIVN